MNIGLHEKIKWVRQSSNQNQNSDLDQRTGSVSRSKAISSGLTLKHPWTEVCSFQMILEGWFYQKCKWGQQEAEDTTVKKL